MRGRILVAVSLAVLASPAAAQTGARPEAQRLPLLLAEDRRASTAADVAALRVGARSRDADTARLAVRALGRLERSALIPAILPALRAVSPDVRSEAANALGQALQGASSATAIDSAASALAARLKIEADPTVRAAIDETLGRLPYDTPAARRRAQRILVGEIDRSGAVLDRLGAAKGLEALARRTRGPLEEDVVAALRELVSPGLSRSDDGPGGNGGRGGTGGAPRDERVRRLALGALISAAAVDEPTVAQAASDPDGQVRQLAMRAAGLPAARSWAPAILDRGLTDSVPLVRYAALEAWQEAGGAGVCTRALAASSDPDTHVALLALDQLRACGGSEDAVARLAQTVNDLSEAGSPRGWHRAAHALEAMAQAAPDSAAPAMGQFVSSSNWHLRVSAARAATTLSDRDVLERLTGDVEDEVTEAAVAGLAAVAGHTADRIYLSVLARPGSAAVRAAARALAGTPDRATAVAVLRAALDRLNAAGQEGSREARLAITDTLGGLGVELPAPARAATRPPATPVMNAADLRRLVSPRARITIRGVGTVDLALFPSEAPATVVRFVRLAQSGYYNGLTFTRVVPNVLAQSERPGASELDGHMRDEVGLWPHVRGAVGISTQGRDTGDGQVFFNLVDNPHFDHAHTVFAQVLTGFEAIDAILEGDVIERIEILTGS